MSTVSPVCSRTRSTSPSQAVPRPTTSLAASSKLSRSGMRASLPAHTRQTPRRQPPDSPTPARSAGPRPHRRPPPPRRRLQPRDVGQDRPSKGAADHRDAPWPTPAPRTLTAAGITNAALAAGVSARYLNPRDRCCSYRCAATADTACLMRSATAAGCDT